MEVEVKKSDVRRDVHVSDHNSQNDVRSPPKPDEGREESEHCCGRNEEEEKGKNTHILFPQHQLLGRQAQASQQGLA
jgi:hypothetical protein